VPYCRPFAGDHGANGAHKGETLIGRIAIFLVLALGALGLAACEGADAPTDLGVCWRVVSTPGSVPKFIRLNNDVASLDDCAAQLEALHIQGARTVGGAYQGYFIFVDPDQITSSPHLKTFRYPIFQPSQRKAIDADLRILIKERNGRLSTGDISVGRK